ncbi:hypothetical protein [Desertivirga arenae]|uniref:hypothetical protein n=1 Tax=Desertivirga arenae TaxID=2810309 RepID=UPI001A979FC3|nr:hypothetical protein [Pedobacter sp. SYSU D00823]
MNINDRGIDTEGDKTSGKTEVNQIPFMDRDDVFLKKKPVNLVITLVLAALALALTVGVAKHYYEKVNNQERLKWESGRLNKGKLDEANAKKHDLFQPLRENWAQYIKAEIEVKPNKTNDHYLILKNNSSKGLERVEVNLYVVNWNGEASNMKSIILSDIRAQETRRMNLGAGGNSKELFCLIKSITAPSFSFCFDKDLETGGKSDPYYCSQEAD